MVNEQNTTPNSKTDFATEQTSQPKSSETGPAVGIAIVVILLIIGGFYFFAQRDADTETGAPTNATSSDELETIEADLEAEFGDVDQELEDIEQEFESLEEQS